MTGPSQAVAIAALRDIGWQSGARQRITEAGELSRRLFAPLLEAHRVTSTGQGLLFTSYRLRREEADRIFDFFARRGILLRQIALDQRDSLLRVGLISPDCHAAKARVCHVIDSYQGRIESD